MTREPPLMHRFLSLHFFYIVGASQTMNGPIHANASSINYHFQLPFPSPLSLSLTD